MDLIAPTLDAQSSRQLARETCDDSRRLAELLRQLRVLMRHPFVLHRSVKEMSELITQLRDELALHFALEEAQGVLQEAAMNEPRLFEEASSLQGQHVTLYCDVCFLAEIAESLCRDRRVTSRHWANQLAVRFEYFDRRLQRHEAAEANLVQEALNVDIGVGD